MWQYIAVQLGRIIPPYGAYWYGPVYPTINLVILAYEKHWLRCLILAA